MAEYIERDALLAEFEKSKRYLKDYCHDEYSAAQLDRCITDIALIDVFPAADVAPVVHAHWINASTTGVGPLWNCSACQELVWVVDSKTGYCPNCGAKMDEVIQGDANLKEAPKPLSGASMRYENCGISVSDLRLPNVDEVAERFGLQRQEGETNNELYGRILHVLLQNPYKDEETEND